MKVGWVSLVENVIESMKRKKTVLEIPHIDNTYNIKNSFG